MHFRSTVPFVADGASVGPHMAGPLSGISQAWASRCIIFARGLPFMPRYARRFPLPWHVPSFSGLACAL